MPPISMRHRWRETKEYSHHEKQLEQPDDWCNSTSGGSRQSEKPDIARRSELYGQNPPLQTLRSAAGSRPVASADLQRTDLLGSRSDHSRYPIARHLESRSECPLDRPHDAASNVRTRALT